MIKFCISIVLGTLCCVSSSLAASVVMEDIEDAGIYCATFSKILVGFIQWPKRDVRARFPAT